MNHCTIHSLLRSLCSLATDLTPPLAWFPRCLGEIILDAAQHESNLRLSLHPWRTTAHTRSCVDAQPGAHGVRPALELRAEFQAVTSASAKDKISTPLFSPLSFKSSLKGSMRMISFRPGVRLFSTFSSRTDAFWGVSQITAVISAEGRNRARGHFFALPRSSRSYREEGIFENFKASGSPKGC